MNPVGKSLETYGQAILAENAFESPDGPGASVSSAAFAFPASVEAPASFAPFVQSDASASQTLPSAPFAAAAALLWIAMACAPAAGGEAEPGKEDKAGREKTGLILFDPFDDESAPSPFDARIDRELSYSDTEGSSRGSQTGGSRRWAIRLSGPGRGAAKGTASRPLFVATGDFWLAMRIYVEKAEGVAIELSSAEEQPRTFSAVFPAAKSSDWSLAFLSRTDFRGRDGGELPPSISVRSIVVSASAVAGAAAGEVRLAVDNVAVIVGVSREDAVKLYADAEKKAVEDSRKRRALEELRKEVTFDFEKTGILLGLPAVENLRARRSAARGANRGTLLKIGGVWAAEARFLDPAAKGGSRDGGGATAKGGGNPGGDGRKRGDEPSARPGSAYRLLAAREISGLSKSSDARKTVEKTLDSLRPETAAIIFDFDELFRGGHPYELYSDASFVIRACLDRGCVPVVFTPPIRQMPKGSGELFLQKSAAAVLKELAERMRVPMVDAFEIANRGDEAAARNFSADGRPRAEVVKEIEEAFAALYRKLEGYVFERDEKATGASPAEPSDAGGKDPKTRRRITDDE
ncbi:MAG: hypothetical protein N3A38_02335 [Planctomycetota bacterium]|nr:hypothetical protein [Planctomycetota bacterium]